MFAFDSSYASNVLCKHLISMIIYKYLQKSNSHHSECKAKIRRKLFLLVINSFCRKFIVKLSNEADFPVLFRNIFTAGENRYVNWSASFFPWRNLCNPVKPNMRDNSLLITKVDSFFITAFVVVSRKNG